MPPVDKTKMVPLKKPQFITCVVLPSCYAEVKSRVIQLLNWSNQLINSKCRNKNVPCTKWTCLSAIGRLQS